ncbi:MULTISPECIES: PstS family phosphate ABC transporter substrate-binding protein [Halorussus]|uniref:PstS family phosphate ABC transporter substrate-binding protein n=2 Tax=Halorussus TaxID=1070314 RepID=A0A8U0I1U8_9EURY|nr:MULTISPECIES: PstS family phosphate ABC transporter substrate-binding protein [Halorussus]UPV77187.1 PstS family phosphate ABC transporter substrate-binding protein [Halorussus limi]
MAQNSGNFSGNVSRRKFLLTASTVGTVGVAGCTRGSDTNGTTTDSNGNNGTSESEALSGDIRISGSSTVYPIAQEVSRQFQQDHSEVGFNLTRDGSSGGFKNVFIPGDSDINNSSRPIADKEVQQCRDNGFEPVEFFIAQDALTIVVNNEADFIDSISLKELQTIWSPDTAPKTWSDVNSDWPDEPLDLYGAATTSGTFDYFTEAVVGEEGKIRGDFEGTEEDDLIAQGVAGSKYAMGYLPFAYYTNNPDTVKALSVSEGGSEPVEPSLKAAQSGNYPLARPLFFYANMNKLQQKNHLQEFIRFYINEADEDYIANEIGYVPSSKQMVEDNLNNLEAAIAGEYEFSR